MWETLGGLRKEKYLLCYSIRSQTTDLVFRPLFRRGSGSKEPQRSDMRKRGSKSKGDNTRMLDSMWRVFRYPTLIPPEIEKLIGRFRAHYEYNTRARISPLARIRPPERFSLGAGTVIHGYSAVIPLKPYFIKFGENCTLGRYSELSGSIRMGDNVIIGNKASIHSANHQISTDQPIRTQDLDIGHIDIEDDVWIGANVTILKDVSIGEGAVIGAGSVVIDDVEAFSIQAGNPAKTIGARK